MQITDEIITATGGTLKPCGFDPMRRDALRYAQWVGVSDLVSAARLIENYIRMSPSHHEAMGIAACQSGHDDELPTVFAAAEAIRAYLAEPAPGGDRAPLSAEP